MRIVEIETFGRGGLAHYVHNLSVALAERGHEVSLLTSSSYELSDRAAVGDDVRVLKAMGRAGHAYGGRLPKLALNQLRRVEAVVDALAVAARVRRLDPDVVQFHCTNRISLLYLMMLERLDCPLVVTAHVVTPHEPIRGQAATYRGIHRRGDLIIAHSAFDKARLLKEFAVEAERVEVIPHGEYGFFERLGKPVDRQAARRSLGLDPQAEVALFFGYIREYKGLDVLLEAWPAVAENREAARLVVAGDPVQLGSKRRRELEHWAKGLGALCHFGYIPFEDVGHYFSSADVVVMPYRRLSQSGVLYLALSLGVPIVATRVGALSETLSDGENGVLVPSESPEELARALRRVLSDADLRASLSRGGLRLAADHAWPRIARRTEGVFGRLVSAHRDAS